MGQARVAMSMVLIDSDSARRQSLAEALRASGHPVTDHPGHPGLALGREPPPRAEVALVAGAEVLGVCARYRKTRRARWILALVAADEVEAALAAGADDCIIAPGDVAQIELRLRVARSMGGLGLDLARPKLLTAGAAGTDAGTDAGTEPESEDLATVGTLLARLRGPQLRVLLDSLPMPLALVSAEGVFLQCNRDFERMFGQDPGSVTGRSLSDLFANENVWEIFARVATQGWVRDQQLELVGHRGGRLMVAGQAQWIPTAEGGFAIGAFVDISERIKAENSLRSVLEATPDGILVHREGRFLYVNPVAVAQLGFASASAAIGQSIYDQVPPGEVEAVRGRIEDMLRSGAPARPRDFRFRRADGEIFVGEVASIPASFEGEPVVITIIRDVSEQRRLQSQMFLTDRLATVGTLAVGVAHEINNPLSWVVGNLGLLADEFDNQVRMRERPGHDREAVAASRTRVRELLGRAQEGTERVRRIVRDLVRFGRPDEAEDETVDVHALLDSAIEIADVQLRHRARLARNYKSQGFVRGGESRLGQVFLNLLVNAGQAIEPGAPRNNEVRIETRDLDDEGWVEISVSDTGCGMSDRVRARVFEPFFTTKPVGEGTGIGLAISQEIVSAAGGEILVDSEEGRGTVFRVRLRPVVDDAPLAATAGSAVSREESDAHQVAPVVRVLVVDDEPLIREMVCDALSNHEVVAVANGRDALEQILAHDWDLILCDVILPEVSGLDVYRELEHKRPEVLDKLVFMTGGDFSRKGPRLPSGARVGRLEKPFSIKALRSLVRKARPDA